MDSPPGSITQCLQKLKAGDRSVTTEIWDRYYPRVVQIASAYLDGHQDRAVDGEDVAQSTFRTVIHALGNGNCSEAKNREDLWKLLFVSTINRVRRHHRDSTAKKRPVFSDARHKSAEQILISTSEDPAAKAEFADVIEHLFGRLDQVDPSGELKRIAALKLDEHSANEIAKSLRRRKIYILQRIRLIRILWEESELL